MEWSPQQQDFLLWCQNGTGSCVLEAVAGAGKTTTILEGAKIITGQTAICAFNKKIADEIKEKLVEKGVDWKKAQAGTVHSFGYNAYRKSRGGTVVTDENKVSNLLEKEYGIEAGGRIELHDMFPHIPIIVQLISLAKQKAFGIVTSMENRDNWFEMADHFDVFDQAEGQVPVEEIITRAIDGLKISANELDVIDFDDMIWMPLYHKARFWQFDNVMVDEAQDTNAARRAMVRAMVKKGGRVIAVGDRHQAIYGFTGADSDALDLIKQDFSAIELPLTTTYRCPKAIVAFAQQWVNHIEAHETAPEGTVSSNTQAEFMKRNDLDGNAAVLCRVTKPLVGLALALIRKRVACKVEGRDVGNALKKLAMRWKVKDLDELEERLDQHLEREKVKLLAKKQEQKLAIVEDSVETIKTIIEECWREGKYEVTDVVEYIDSLFANNVRGILVLSTIHKAKGREWERVFWLDRAGTCPSKWARQAWQKQQEVNLQYVAATRAKSELIDIIPSNEQKQEAPANANHG